MATTTVTLDGASPSEQRLRAFWTFFRDELRPTPDRYALLFRLIAAVLLALWIDMAFGLSEIGLGLYMPFFLIKGSLKKNAMTMVLLAGASVVSVLYMMFVIDVLGGSPPVRFIAETFIVLAGVYMVKVSPISQPWLILALFGGSFLRSWDAGHTAASNLASSLSLILTIMIGAGSAVFVQYILAVKGPLQELQESLVAPLDAVIDTLSAHVDQRSPAVGRKRLQKLSLGGATASKELLEDAVKRNDRVKLVHARLSGAIEAVTMLVDQALWFSLRCGDSMSVEDGSALRTVVIQLRALQQVVREGGVAATVSYSSHHQLSAPVMALTEAAQTLAAVLCGERVLPVGHEEKAKGGLFKPGALKDKSNLVSALKTTLAVTICYGLYSGVDWSQIDASVTTCIVTTQDSDGMERQKQVLRLIGDSLAGLCAIGSIVFLLPHLSSVAGLTAVVGIITFLGGYVFLGSYRLSYAGRQLSYCFFLATLNTTSTPTSLTEARDRVVAVMLGVFVMWAVYDQIKPVWTSLKMREAVVEALASLQKIGPLRAASCSATDKLKELAAIRSSFGKALQLLQMNSELRAFEVTMTQIGHERRKPVITQIMQLLLQVFLRDISAVEGDILDLETAEQRQCTSQASMSQLVSLSKALSTPDASPPSGKSTTDTMLLDQVHTVLQDSLHV